MKNITGVETITTKGSTGALTLNNVATSTVGFGFEGSSTNNITANHVAGALAGTNDILKVNLNGAKEVALTVAAGFESAKITTAGTNDVTTLTAPGVTTYTVEGTGSVNFKNNLANVTTLSATNNSGAITTGTVNATTGFVNQAIAAGTNGASVLLGAGNDNIGFTATATKTSTVKLGAGDDKLLLKAAGAVAGATYVFGEAGNDTIKIHSASLALTTSDLIDGGEGTDTLVIDNNAANQMVLRGVEKLTLTNTANGANVINSADSAIAVTVEAGNAGTATAASITGLTSGSTVTVNDSKDQTVGVAALTVGYKALEAAATIDVNSVKAAGAVTINNVSAATIDYAKTADSSAGHITTDETTSLNIIAAKSVTTGNIISSNNKLKTLTITGQDAVTTGDASSTALETVTVSGVKPVQTGAFANAGKLKTVNVTSTTDNATVGNIGATTNNTTDALNITVSAAKAATLGTVGAGAGAAKLGDISVTATKGLLTAGAITGADAGTITLTSTDDAIKATAVTVADATGVTVNMTAKTFITDSGATGGGAITVQNTGGNITASVAGAAAAKVNYTAVTKGVVNLTATNTGGLASTVANAGTIADALTSTITLGNAVTTKTNDVTINGTVATLNVTGGTGVDNIILTAAQVKSGTIALGTTLAKADLDSVDFTDIKGAVSGTDALGVVINLGSTAYKIDAGTAYETSVAAGHAVEYNAAAGATAKKLVTDGFDLTLSGVEKVTGTANADIIIANAEGSTIIGGNGADKIISGAGADTIILTESVSAADTVKFSAVSDSAASVAANTTVTFDKIVDFNAGANNAAIDLISITGANFVAGAAAMTAGAVNILTTATGGINLASTTINDFAGLAALTNATNMAKSAAGGINAYIIDLTGNTGALGTGKYLVINDANDGLQATDLMIEITGYQGTFDATDFVVA